MKHNAEYYKKRQKQLDRRYDKISVEIENLLIELHEKQAELDFLKSVQQLIENKMQSLDTQSEIDTFLDRMFPKGWYTK